VSALFDSGRIVDLILVLVVLEALLLLGLRVRRGGGIMPRALLANLLAGACLLLALRSALTGADWVWPAMFLLLALPAHLADLYGRWNRAA
jgi:hypothetical protein